MNTRQISVFLMAFVLVFLPGCSTTEPGVPTGSVPGREDTRSQNTGRVAARWPFWPTRMRIHRLTMQRLDPRTKAPAIEARIEFFDSFGHTVKGVAQFRFELHDHDPGESADRPLREWNVDLRDPMKNAVHWDTVTMTYLFRLTLDNVLEGGPWYLRAHVLSIDGQTFVQTIQL